MDLEIPTKYDIHKGTYQISYCRPTTNMDILQRPSLYSYAFIFGPNSKRPNFSYTVDME